MCGRSSITTWLYSWPITPLEHLFLRTLPHLPYSLSIRKRSRYRRNGSGLLVHGEHVRIDSAHLVPIPDKGIPDSTVRSGKNHVSVMRLLGERDHGSPAIFAPRSLLDPQAQQNHCIASSIGRVRPYHAPFERAASILVPAGQQRSKSKSNLLQQDILVGNK